jgi:hypothetical protein
VVFLALGLLRRRLRVPALLYPDPNTRFADISAGPPMQKRHDFGSSGVRALRIVSDTRKIRMPRTDSAR